MTFFTDCLGNLHAGNPAIFTVPLILLPFLAGLFSFFLRKDSLRRNLLLGISGLHFLTVSLLPLLKYPCSMVAATAVPATNPQRALLALGDAGSYLFLFISSLLFLSASFYAVRYLQLEKETPRKDEKGFLFKNEPESVFTACMLLFLSAMSLVCLSAHLGLMWAAIEATTLFSAPLIYFHRSKRSLEATWKYLVICSVGIALALLGTFFLSLAGIKSGGDLYFGELLLKAGTLNPAWLKISFIFLFIGYGTKMGIAPMHTWLPDAHSEAPSVVSALLSGALLNCAFLGIWKVHKICSVAGLGKFSGDIFIYFGLLSIATAALFIINQKEYKRALAYSSIENMGILLLALGLGNRISESVVLINAFGHSMIKAGLFFIAGLILIDYRSKNINEVGLMAKRTPLTASLWFAGFLLLMGTPPSPLFFSKFAVFKILLGESLWLPAAILFVSLALIFIGFSRIFISMVFGSNDRDLSEERLSEHGEMLLPSLALFAGSILGMLCLGYFFYEVFL